MKWQDAILHQKFHDRNPAEVAKELIGKLLVRRIDGEYLVGMISETEAYLPSGDAAAHNFKGQTKRNASLYKEGGHAYVHSMRQYCLLDAVTQGRDVPGSVLIRAIEPIEGVQGLVNGPGKVCREFKIAKTLDGVDMTNPESELFIAEDEKDVLHKINISSRVGISKAKDMPLRFYVSAVSAKSLGTKK
ncbi:MAG: DNA-3-methyladenine glycosylase [bacterium]